MAPIFCLVTGSTSGIGAALVQEIISRGNKVIATGRKVEQRLSHLKIDKTALLELDTTADRGTTVEALQEAWKIFGHIDTVVNNAVVSAMKSAEEAE